MRRFASASLACLISVAMSTAHANGVQNCHIGAYRLTNGTLIDIDPEMGMEMSDTLRWIQLNGKTGQIHEGANGKWSGTIGWTHHDDGTVVSFSACPESRIQFNGISGQRIPFAVQNTTFESRGVKLAGRLVMPTGTDKVPVVVLLHGSDPGSGLDGFFLQRMLPAQGVGAFVFDKRGTGKSGGKYTQDYDVLADDGVAAMREARRLAGARAGRVGYQGGSQAGWVAPLAASRAPVDFVVAAYGLAINVIEEDQQSVELQLREKGYSPSDIAVALSVASAAEAVFESNFAQEKIDQFNAIRTKYRGARWYKDLEGDYTWIFLPKSKAELRAMAPQFDWHVPFRYDPMPVLRNATVPELWVLGGEDYEAPSAETRRRLESLIANGRPFTVAYYPHADHVMISFENGKDGSRIGTGFVPGFFQMIRDFAVDGQLHGTYGDAELTAPHTRHS